MFAIQILVVSLFISLFAGCQTIWIATTIANTREQVRTSLAIMSTFLSLGGIGAFIAVISIVPDLLAFGDTLGLLITTIAMVVGSVMTALGVLRKGLPGWLRAIVTIVGGVQAAFGVYFLIAVVVFVRSS